MHLEQGRVCFCPGRGRPDSIFALRGGRSHSSARTLTAVCCGAIAVVHPLASSARALGTPRARAGPRENTPFFPSIACGSGRTRTRTRTNTNPNDLGHVPRVLAGQVRGERAWDLYVEDVVAGGVPRLLPGHGAAGIALLLERDD